VLPAVDTPADISITNAEPAMPAAAGPHPHETILMVEDEDALRQVTGRILTRAGYDVLPANCGAQAIHIAQTHPTPIDLLLTDVIMPKMMGNEVATRIQTIRPDIPVLYMSGYAQPVLTENGTLQDGVTLVEKPFTGRELLHRINTVLHQHHPSSSTQSEPLHLSHLSATQQPRPSP
jgi:two-component system, cell cycle sensor histidine kinase and response regulator CckA